MSFFEYIQYTYIREQIEIEKLYNKSDSKLHANNT